MEQSLKREYSPRDAHAHRSSPEEIPEIKPEAVGMSAERLARIPGRMQTLVNRNELAGMVVLVARDGAIVHRSSTGLMDREQRRPMREDAIFRIYSMTKPITSVALMMLFEEGLFRLNDPVSAFIPEMKGMKVFAGQGSEGPILEDAKHEMTVRELLSHTGGLTYPFGGGPVEKLYEEADLFNFGLTVRESVAKMARLPLAFQPGEDWLYGMSHEVQGYLIEVLTGLPLERFLQDRVFGPLDMRDTGFAVCPANLERFATNYLVTPNGQIPFAGSPVRTGNERIRPYSEEVVFHSGGGGLVSTARDYMRFAQMLADGGALNDVRLIGPKTIELMTLDNMPFGATVIMGGRPRPGIRYGLGFGLKLDPVAAGTLGSLGEFYWHGAANTIFWVDPVENIVVVAMAQRLPDDSPLNEDLHSLVYAAVTLTRPRRM